ncbi:MAG: DEAD/DEAH box helicase, partial [Pirellulales bacterium]|nr:DEAD/DEAH box helicase [Pirellulales bacterium]
MNDSFLTDLPIAPCLAEIVAALDVGQPVVLKAPPGAGKTTGVPPALLSTDLPTQGQIVLVQPRRMAARTAAARLAKQVRTPVGQDVGYHVRFDRRAGQETKLLVVTTGILLRRLQSDPLLEDVACVILDEFHERSLDLDLTLGMLHRIRTTLRPELKLMVMSATLDPQPIAEFLGDACPVISEGRSFPVDIEHVKQRSQQRIEEQIAALVPGVLRQTKGHVLVFLPGVGEIRSTESVLQRTVSFDGDVLALYGDLAPKQQDAVLQNTGRRKLILATNVAETSITIAGVTAVIDSGLARVMRFDSAVGLPRLQLEPISQASAQQRAGRAGRTEPGRCIRLWPANTHRSRPERDTPEIERTDFSGAALTLAAWGEKDVFDFPWLTPPPEKSVSAAMILLQKLDALAADGSATNLGRRMLSMPLHPRLARFLLAANDFGVVEDGTLAAALLTERDPFRRGVVQAPPLCRCDVSAKIQRLKSCWAGDREAAMDMAAA